MIAVIEYTPETAHMMRADYIARRARLYAVPPEPIVEVTPEPEPEVTPEPEPEAPKPVKRRLGLFLKPAPIVNDAVHEWLLLASPGSTRPAMSSLILSMVTNETGIHRFEILGESRTAKIVRARQLCCYLMRQCTPMSLPEIGRRLGGRDHTTILHAVRNITALMQSEPALAEMIERLIAVLKPAEDSEPQAEEVAA